MCCPQAVSAHFAEARGHWLTSPTLSHLTDGRAAGEELRSSAPGQTSPSGSLPKGRSQTGAGASRAAGCAPPAPPLPPPQRAAWPPWAERARGPALPVCGVSRPGLAAPCSPEHPGAVLPGTSLTLPRPLPVLRTVACSAPAQRAEARETVRAVRLVCSLRCTVWPREARAPSELVEATR